jgi:general secretion pathway protein G
MKKVLKKRTGFTLVELLIVIIIIGILAGAMLLVAGSGTDKAEATKIVSNLRSIKAAALMYYADKPGTPPATGVTKAKDVFKSYMDKEMPDEYVVLVTSDDDVWFVGLEDSTIMTSGVKGKLNDVATDSGLLGSDSTDTPPAKSGDYYETFNNNHNAVWMRAR